MTTAELDMLRAQWIELYSKSLPALARARDAAQPKWPVTLDHCFARIILDNTVGRGILQWDNVIRKPAVNNMDVKQFQEAIELGQNIQRGAIDLVELDKTSLKARGKGNRRYKNETEPQTKTETETGSNLVKGTKRSHEPAPIQLPIGEDKHISGPSSPPQKKQKQSTLPFASSLSAKKEIKPETAKLQAEEEVSPSKFGRSKAQSQRPSSTDPDISLLLDKIASHQGLTPYRKRLYSTLLSVPVGKYTTYAAMAKYLESSARAVGNGMRNNPFAPDVPCHRVIAADGSLGGFHGHWGKDGKYAGNKVSLLDGEGVRFDSRGKVKGPVFTDLADLSKGR